MSYEPVDFFLKDDSVVSAPIPGAVVKVFSADGTYVYGQQLTDVDGRAAFLLPSAYSFQARFYKQATTFVQRQLFAVLEAPARNVFDVVGSPFTLPLSTDPNVCVTYGFFRTATGAPAANIEIEVVAQFRPLLLDGSAVVTPRASVRTNDRGYAEIPLIRLGIYDVLVQGFEPNTRRVCVPDRVNANLPDLLFPVVEAVVFDVTGPYALVVGGEDLLVTPVVLATNGQVLDGLALGDVIFRSSDTGVLGISYAGRALALRGLAPGSATIQILRADTSIVRYPDPGIVGDGAVVVVS